MRYYELFEATLQGASIASWANYLQNMLAVPSLSLGENGEKAKGLQLTAQSKKIVQALLNQLVSEGNDRAFVKIIENTQVGFTNNTIAFIKQIYKSPDLKSGAATTETGEINKSKKYWNDGEVAETFLGAAIYTRFLSESNITMDDILETMKNDEEFRPTDSGFEGDGQRGTNPVNMVTINKKQNNQVVTDYLWNKSMLEGRFPQDVKSLTKTLEACTAYVNQSSKVKDALKQCDDHPKAKEIQIRTDGVTDQRGTKADLQIKVGDTLRLLSLKANDVKQFGQNTGQSGDIIANFFKSFIPSVNISSLYKDANGKPKKWNPDTKKGWPDMSVSGRKILKANNQFDDAVDQIYELTGKAYKIAKKELESSLKENPDAVIASLYKGIVQHAQGSAEGQTLVILNPDSKTAWKELEFGPQLKKALKSFRIYVKLAVSGESGATNHILRVFGEPKDGKAAVAMANKIGTESAAKSAKNKAKKVSTKTIGAVSPEMLFQLRSYLQNHDTQRNIIEMGLLLKSITEVQKINDLKKTPQK